MGGTTELKYICKQFHGCTTVLPPPTHDGAQPSAAPVYVCAIPPPPDLEELMPAARPDGSPAPLQVTPGPHPHVPHTVTGTMPDGLIYQPQEGRYIKDTATGIILGHAPCFTSGLQARLEHAVLKERLGCFSFSLLNLPEYSGPVPDVKINLIINKKATHSEEHASSRRRTRKTQNLGPQQRTQKAKENYKIK